MAEGYPDYQRVANMDGPVLHAGNTTKLTEAINSFGPFSVSRYAGVFIGVGGAFLKENATITWELEWSSEKEGGVSCGKLVFVTVFGITPPLEALVLNRGPWLRVRAVPSAHPANTVFNLIASNRLPPSGQAILLGQQAIIPRQAFSLKAGEAKQISPAAYWAGVLQVQLDNVTNTTHMLIEYAEGGGGYQSAFYVQPSAVTQQYRPVVPFGAWRLNVINESAAEQTYGVTAMPELS